MNGGYRTPSLTIEFIESLKHIIDKLRGCFLGNLFSYEYESYGNIEGDVISSRQISNCNQSMMDSY